MTTDELKELGIDVWSDFGAYNEGGNYVSVEDATKLARKVIAADKLADAVRREISRSQRHLALSTMTAIAEYEDTA